MTALVSSSADVFRWLSRFINFEQGQRFKSFRLDRMEALLAWAGHPEKSAPVIHVAGSKGKGSLTGMISAILEAEGLNVARYTSPHVTDYRERIANGKVFFDESIYIEAGKELVSIEKALEEALRNKAKPESAFSNAQEEDNPEPTFFELLTLYFFLCARKAQCDVMVVETGMGGRLDATNVVDPLVSVITLIEKEHTDYLGETITAIAGEKAGIIKPRRPLILAEQVPEALDVFNKAALSKQAPLCYFPDAVRLKHCRLSLAGTAFTLEFRKPGFFPSPMELAIAVPGEIQAKNAGLAILAAKTAFPSLSQESVITGLKDFSLPARFERIQDDPSLIIDGAHTPQSIEACIQTFTYLYGNRGVLLFGSVAGKDAGTMARLLIPHFSTIIITTPGTFKISYPEELYAIFTAEKNIIETAACQTARPRNLPALFYIQETGKALEKALELAKEQRLAILGTGSFYLAAEIKNAVSPEGYSR